MFYQNTNKVQARAMRSGKGLVASVAALLFGLAIAPARAHAQIIGYIDANIPFQFHAGDAKLPPGKYNIHMLDNSDLSIMEISSADGSVSAAFEVESAQAGSAPAKTELIFNKYGKSYFLAKVFDGENPDGSRVVPSHYEKKIRQQMTATEEHLAALHGKK